MYLSGCLGWRCFPGSIFLLVLWFFSYTYINGCLCSFLGACVRVGSAFLVHTSCWVLVFLVGCLCSLLGARVPCWVFVLGSALPFWFTLLHRRLHSLLVASAGCLRVRLLGACVGVGFAACVHMSRWVRVILVGCLCCYRLALLFWFALHVGFTVFSCPINNGCLN